MENLVFSPFALKLSALDAFFEIPFSGHDVYHSLEVQKWRLPEGEQTLVLMTQLSGAVDVYHHESQTLDEHWFNGEAATALHQLGSLVPTSFRELQFSVDAEGLSVDIDFSDAQGRQIKLTAREPFQQDKETFSVFTPAPFRLQPTLLRFLSMRRLALCRRAFAEFDMQIDGNFMVPVILPGSRFLPLPLRGSLRYSARYCADLLLASLAPETVVDCHLIGDEGSLVAKLADADGPVWVAGDGGETQFDSGKNGELLIVAQRIQNQKGALIMTFEPPFPALMPALSDRNGSGEGAFEVSISGEGVCQGLYEFAHVDGKLSLDLKNVTQGWRPDRPSVSVRVLLWLRKLRRRGQQYHLSASITVDETREPVLFSKWTGLKV